MIYTLEFFWSNQRPDEGLLWFFFVVNIPVIYI